MEISVKNREKNKDKKEKLNKKNKSFSIRKQLLLTFGISIFIIFVIYLFVFIRLDAQMQSLDDVYASNRFNGELSAKIEAVNNELKEYMVTKDSKVLENYYLLAEDLHQTANNMEVSIEDNNESLMYYDIKNMIYSFLELNENTISYKRGRNIKKYQESYESSVEMYNYLEDYIYTINNIEFDQNSKYYATMRKAMHFLELISFVILVFVGCLGFSIVHILTDKIIHPLTKLSDNAKVLATGNFDITIDSVDRNDEIGVLSRAFSNMKKSIKEYMENEKKTIEEKRDIRERELKMEARVKDAELRYFQSQVDPHFLFNTLNAGVQLAMLEDASKTSEYIDSVAKFFRYNLKKDNGLTTISEEVKLVDYYMAILNVRFGGDVKLEKNIDESLLGYSIPKMVIQPLVENAIDYGIQSAEGEGTVYLSILPGDDEALISIADKGVGMEKEVIDAILDSSYVSEKAGSNGVGITNIISRLRLCYNKEHVLDIISDGPGTGVEIIIHVPLT